MKESEREREREREREGEREKLLKKTMESNGNADHNNLSIQNSHNR